MSDPYKITHAVTHVATFNAPLGGAIWPSFFEGLLRALTDGGLCLYAPAVPTMALPTPAPARPLVTFIEDE